MTARSRFALAASLVCLFILGLPAAALASETPDAPVVYTLIYASAGSYGSIVGSATQSVPSGGEGTTVTALPRTGYHFVGWSDGRAGALRRDTDVSADVSVTASFEKNLPRATTTKLFGSSAATLGVILRLTGTVTSRTLPVTSRTASGTVVITKTRMVGGKRVAMGAVRVRVSRGSYVYRFKPTALGNWRFVARYSGGISGDATFKASVSAPKTVPVSNGMFFPVRGHVSWSDGFGAPRSGHTHQGQDLAAANGTPVVASVSGYISSKTGSSAGKWITLRGTRYTMWYMHLSRFAVTKGYVKAGQVIGYVGCTGNPGPGNYHLHFEIHPGGGSAVNPRSYLLAMRR